MNYVAAQEPLTAAAPMKPATAAEAKTLKHWLMRMHEASRNRAYTGIFVVSAGGSMSSAKIWHVCEGREQMELIETLSGAPRSIFRHNDQVLTLMPENKLARSEKRESLGLFSELFQSADSHIADFYQVRQEGIERVAGVEADISMLLPRDALRFGYRVWTERKNGLVVKLQTLDIDGKVLEQSAFSELQLDAPIKMDKLVQMMGQLDGYHVEKPVLLKTTASAQGWMLKTPIAGFKPVSCYKRPVTASAMPTAALGKEPLQWVFSDGLASVSIFIEPLDRQHPIQESSFALGATRTLTRQMAGYWVTVMGEVPITTLQLFTSALARKE